MISKSRALLAVIICALSVAAYGQPQEDKFGIVIDKKPFRAFSVEAKRRIDSESINTKAPFRVELAVALDASGKFEAAGTRIIKEEGDGNLVELLKDGVIAFGESGWFGYVYSMPDKPRNFSIVVEQNNETFTASLRCTAPSANHAKSVASSLSMIFALAHQTSESTMPAGEKLILQNIKVVTEESSYLMTLSLPANIARDILTEGLTPGERHTK